LKPVIILYTHWGPDYWEKPREAPYPRLNYKDLNNWDELCALLPLPGLGIYTRGRIKGKYVDYRKSPLVYLCVKDMKYNEKEEPIFSTEPVMIGRVESLRFLEKVGHHRLFEVRSFEEVKGILNSLGESPSSEWIELAKKVQTEDWHSWIGQHFLKLENKSISNKEFEDTVADVFRALGFEVKQLGHKKKGAHPDGLAIARPPYDFALIYDCKNIEAYYPTESDIRALREYVRKWKPRIQDRHSNVVRVFSCFVAKSFKTKRGADVFLDSTTLLQLLYEKLKKGPDFTIDSVIS